MSSTESVSRAHRIMAEQKQLVASLSDAELFTQLRTKVLDVFTHKTTPSYMSIPVDHERDDDCYVALRLDEMRDRLRSASAEVSRQWINATERLPEQGVYVLCYWKIMGSEEMHVLTYDHQAKIWLRECDHADDNNWQAPDYWIPLPSVPASGRESPK